MVAFDIYFMTKLWRYDHDIFQDAKQEDISAHFQTFGEIDNINIKTDPATGRSRWDFFFLSEN